MVIVVAMVMVIVKCCMVGGRFVAANMFSIFFLKLGFIITGNLWRLAVGAGVLILFHEY